MIDSDPIHERFMSLSPHLSERERRLFVATEARAAGYGGIAAGVGAVADVVEIGWWRSLWFVQRTISGVRAPAETTPWKRLA